MRNAPSDRAASHDIGTTMLEASEKPDRQTLKAHPLSLPPIVAILRFTTAKTCASVAIHEDTTNLADSKPPNATGMFPGPLPVPGANDQRTKNIGGV
jgi:hypothetical protein